METVIQSGKCEKDTYPMLRIMRGTGNIYLFFNKEKGVLVAQGKDNNDEWCLGAELTGTYASSPFTGSVCLAN